MNDLEIRELLEKLNNISLSISASTIPVPCPTGEGYVASLTEAVIGNTVATMKVAEAINNLKFTIEDK